MEAAELISASFWESDAVHLMAASGEPPLAVPVLPAGATARIFFRTSGSTGVPKWIGHSRSSLLASAVAVNAHLRVTAESCWALALPVHHVGGFGVMARSWLAGCRVAVFPQRWNAVAFTEWLTEQQATHLSLVPTQVHDLVAERCAAPPSLKAVVVGGGVLPVATGQAARELGWPVLSSYGATETGSQIATLSLDLLDQPYQTAPIDIIDPWQADVTEEGHLELSGPSLFSGTLIPDESGGWKYEERSSGPWVASDLARVAEGRLTIFGRADTLVKILGELVDPLAVEAELLALCKAAPGSLAVAAPRDLRSGHALIVLHEPSVSLQTVAAALAMYDATAPGFRRISRTVQIPAIPRSPLGKVLRAELLRHI